MNRWFLYCFYLILGSNCFADSLLTKQVVLKNIKDLGIIISDDDESLIVSIKTSSLEPENKGQINVTLSSAKFGGKENFKIAVKPNDFARNYPEKSYFTSDFIWLLDDKGKKISWKKGGWELVLCLQLKDKITFYRPKFEIKSAKRLTWEEMKKIVVESGGEF